MRNATLLILCCVGVPVMANTGVQVEIENALKARTHLVKSIDQASYIGGSCKDKARTALNEMKHQDRQNESNLGASSIHYWKHARYAYESSQRRLQQSNCSVK